MPPTFYEKNCIMMLFFIKYPYSVCSRPSSRVEMAVVTFKYSYMSRNSSLS